MNRTPVKPIDLVLDIIKEDYKIIDGVVTRQDGYIGSLNRHGYMQFKINFGGYKDRVTISAHHIAWFLYYGFWPERELDHEDRNKQNNRKDNLRYSDPNSQMYNTKNRRKTSDLPRGVKLKKGRYEVYIRWRGKKVYMGSYKTAEEAGERYKQCHEELSRISPL